MMPGKDLFRLFIGGSGAAGDKLKISRKIHLLPLYRLAVDHQLDHRMRGNGGVLAVSAIYRKFKIPAQRHSGGTVRPAPGVLCFKFRGRHRNRRLVARDKIVFPEQFLRLASPSSVKLTDTAKSWYSISRGTANSARNALPASSVPAAV